MESAAIARRFVEGLNTFDLTTVRALLTTDFEFTIGTHTADRDDFLASLATGGRPASSRRRRRAFCGSSWTAR